MASTFSLGPVSVIADVDVRTGVGVINIPQWQDAINALPALMEAGAQRVNAAIVDEMVAEAQSRVPVRSGRLRAGITRQTDGNDLLFVASAQRDSRSEDYAHFVEFGTAGGVAGQSYVSSEHAGLFSGSGAATSAYARRRRARRTGGGSPAQPFYLPALRVVLARHHLDMSNVVVSAGRAQGFDVRPA